MTVRVGVMVEAVGMTKMDKEVWGLFKEVLTLVYSVPPDVIKEFEDKIFK